jgi:hypothetical protein
LAATSLADLLVGEPRSTEDGELFIISLCGGYQLILSPNHVVNPRQGGRVDWNRVTRIKVTSISDHA